MVFFPVILFGQSSQTSGCTDNTACNYDSFATIDDNSCVAVEALCSEIFKPISSSTLLTLNLNNKFIMKKIVNAERKQKAPTLTIPIN